MNYLTTLCKASEPNTWDIYWRNGVQIQGVVKVTVTTTVDDPEIIAELSVIQWLLEHRSLHGVSQAGKGLSLTVSAGAIKKLAKAAEKNLDLRESSLGKAHLFPYAGFLGTRFYGAIITVAKDDSWIKPRAEQDVAALSIAEPLPEVIEIKGIGQVELSAHVLQQFARRQGVSDREEMWRLLRQIASSGLKPVKVNEEFLLKKYGYIGQVMAHEATKWAFVIVPGDPLPVVATAYATKASRIGV